MNLNRRTFLLSTGVGASALPVAAQTAGSASSYAARYPDMLLTYVAAKLNALNASWDRKRDQIRSAADVEARNRYVRTKFQEMLHGFPERTPLNARTVAVHDRDGYRVENVLFESLPNFWVTANLYVPAGGHAPYPAVLSPCGHYPWSRMEPEYQLVYLDLVKAGFVVLAYDPIGQGERRQYWNPQTNETEVATASTYEHSMPGQVLLLMGEDLTHYRVWDGMRGIDYLEQRPEVDRNRIACAGHSGGGTLTMFISALDQRVKCAVIAEGGTQARWPVEIEPGSRVGPSDVEQNYFPGAKLGIDHPDLHIAIAPRPLLALIENYNPRFNRAAEQIRQRYVQLGVPDHFATGEATDPHSWTPKLRLATVRWLSRWLLESAGPDREPDVTVEHHDTLYCTPDGSLRYSEIGDSIFSRILKKQETLPLHRDLSAADLSREATELLRFKKSDVPLAPRTLVTTPRKGYSVEKLEFISEPGIYIPTWVFVPERKAASYETVLAFNDAGKQADGLEFGLYEKLAREGKMVIACDVRGIGETRPPHNNGESSSEFKQLFDVETAIVYMAWYMDEDLFGMRVRDVVRGVDYALSRPGVDTQHLRVTGKGEGALWVLFAAALDPRIADVTAERGLLSYRTLALVDRYLHGGGIFVRDLLLHFDLPQLTACLAGRNVTLVSPVDHMKHPVSLEAARRTYAVAESAFAKSGGQFRIARSA